MRTCDFAVEACPSRVSAGGIQGPLGDADALHMEEESSILKDFFCMIRRWTLDCRILQVLEAMLRTLRHHLHLRP